MMISSALNMSKYEKLRESIGLIKSQAVERKARERSLQLKEQQERLNEERRRKEYLRKCEESWPAAKSCILGVFQEINREVLESQASVRPWTTVRIKHNHIGTTTGIALGVGGGAHYNFRYEATMEVAELVVGSVGKIIASRELRSKYTQKRGKPVINPDASGAIYINTCGSKDILCEYCDSFERGGRNSVSLEDQPELISVKAREIISEQLIDLMARHYQK